MLVEALDEVRRDAGVGRSIALAGEDVDCRLKVALHLKSLLGSRFRGNDEGGEKRPFSIESARRSTAKTSAASASTSGALATLGRTIQA